MLLGRILAKGNSLRLLGHADLPGKDLPVNSKNEI